MWLPDDSLTRLGKLSPQLFVKIKSMCTWITDKKNKAENKLVLWEGEMNISEREGGKKRKFL